METENKIRISQPRHIKNQTKWEHEKLRETYVETEMNWNELLEVVLALQRNINESTNASKTFQLKRMLMQVKQIFKECGGNYA